MMTAMTITAAAVPASTRKATSAARSSASGQGERMAQVPPGFNDQISSMRIFGRTEVTVYQGRDFHEPSLRLRDDVANLQNYQVQPGHSWNDRVSSIEVDPRNQGD